MREYYVIALSAGQAGQPTTTESLKRLSAPALRSLPSIPQTKGMAVARLATNEALVRVATPRPVTSAQSVLSAVQEAARNAGRPGAPPRLVAVSKKQPVEKVQAAYEDGLRHFGENYVQELSSKAAYLQSVGDCSDIRWHFIGNLQRNKTRLLVNTPGLWMVESIDTKKAAQSVDKHWSLSDTASGPLRVLLQVNTGREESKHGCLPEHCVELAQFILDQCNGLKLCGLMTIGRSDHPYHQHNPDFLTLLKCYETVQDSLQVKQKLELSMGMSADYHQAIQMGSTNVRIGSAIFGPRQE